MRLLFVALLISAVFASGARAAEPAVPEGSRDRFLSEVPDFGQGKIPPGPHYNNPQSGTPRSGNEASTPAIGSLGIANSPPTKRASWRGPNGKLNKQSIVSDQQGGGVIGQTPGQGPSPTAAPARKR